MVDNNKNKNNFLKAFSLAEVLLSMLILTVFIMGTIKVTTVLTSKPKSEKMVYPHGLYECFYEGNTLKKYYSLEGNKQIAGNADASTFCTFTSPKGVGSLSISIVFANKKGVYTFQEPYADTTIKLYPSKYEASSATAASLVNSEQTSAFATYNTTDSAVSNALETLAIFKAYYEISNPDSNIKNNGGFLQSTAGSNSKSGAIIISW